MAENLITKKERGSYGLYFTGQNMIYIFVMNYLQNYFTDVVGITAGAVAVILLIARIWDAVNDPLFGVIVDRSRLRDGRFRPWLKLSTWLIPIFTVLLFCVPVAWPLNVKTAVCAVLYICWGMSYTICDVPAHSLSTAMTNNLTERTALISKGRFHSMLGILTVMVLTVPLVNQLTKHSGSVPLAWLIASIVIAVCAFFLMRGLGKNAQERFIDQDSEPLGFRAIFDYLKGNKYLMIFFGAQIIANLTNTMTTLPLYFANVNLGDSNKYLLLVAVSMVASPIVSLALPKINRHVDKFTIYMLGLGLSIVMSVVIYLVGYEGSRFVPFLILCAVKGFGASCSLVMSFMFSADCIEYGHYVNGHRAEGVTFSIQTFTTVMTGAISGSLAMGLLGWLFHYQSAYYEGGVLITPVQPESAANGIWLLMSIFPAIGAAAAFVILLRFYKLRDKDVQIMADVNSGKISREEGETRLAARKGAKKR